MAVEERGHERVPEPYADLEAGNPRLGHLEESLPDAVVIADAHLVIWHAGDGEVLAERAWGHRPASQESLPVMVGLDLVNVDGAVLAAMGGQVGLGVAVHVSAADEPRPFGGVFEYGGGGGTPAALVPPPGGP